MTIGIVDFMKESISPKIIEKDFFLCLKCMTSFVNYLYVQFFSCKKEEIDAR